MGKAQPLKDIGQFFEGMVRDTVGNLTGATQRMRQSKELYHHRQVQSRTAEYQKFDPASIEAFAQMGSELTGKTKAELEAAKPKAFKTKEYMGTKLQPWNNYGGLQGGTADAAAISTKRYEQEWAQKTEQEKRKIEGLYKTSHARLGAIEQGRLRPGARKQTVLTKRKY